MTPQINIENSTIERMKPHAEPLVDSYDSVINRALDALEKIKSDSGTSNSLERVLNPAAPPNLAYTTVNTIVWKGNRLPPAEAYWNTFLLAVIRECGKHMTKEQIRKLIICNFVTGRKEDNGYKYLDDVGISVQGQDANNAWKATYHILKAIKIPVEVVFTWQDNPKAASPGVVGKFNVSFS